MNAFSQSSATYRYVYMYHPYLSYVFYKGCFDYSILSILQQMFYLIYFTTELKSHYIGIAKKGDGVRLPSVSILF